MRIRLKRDIEVLFFIAGFKKHYVLSNQEEKKSPEFLQKLREENLDGWLASIENRSHVEVAIMNDPTIYEMISFEPLRKNWVEFQNAKIGELCIQFLRVRFLLFISKNICDL